MIIKNIECLVCNQTFKNKQAFSAHFRHHSINIEDYYIRYLRKNVEEGICQKEGCNNKTSFISSLKGYNRYCSIRCGNSDKKIKDQIKQTNISKFGCHPMQNKVIVDKAIKTKSLKTDEDREKIKEKRAKTNLMKYDTTNPSKCQEIKDKISERLKTDEVKNKIKQSYNAYVGGHPSKDDSIKDKKFKTRIEKLKSKRINLFTSLNLKLISSHNTSKGTIVLKCNRCDNTFESNHFSISQGYGKCKTCYPKGSGQEIEVAKFIKGIGDFHVIQNDRSTIKPYELDIILPDLGLAIEYCGLYWHSNETITDRLYHYNKMKLCLDNDISLIQIFEDEWISKKDIVKHRLSNILNKNNGVKVYARQCKIKEINPKTKNEFLDQFHLQGSDSSIVKLGGFYKDNLIAVMTFSHGSISKGKRKTNEFIWELNRYCVDYNYRCIGLASKMLEWFKRRYDWIEIFSYCDRRWSKGNMYYRLGFDLVKETGPNYWYIKGLRRIHRFGLKKTNEDRKGGLTEGMLRVKQGYSIIWDCGCLKFNMTNKAEVIDFCGKNI